jgi:hypothetical protein
MTKTNTQNRPYDGDPLPMTAVFLPVGSPREVLEFDWNNRAEVRNFAAQSDRIVREGGTTILGTGAVPLANAPFEVELWQRLSLTADQIDRERIANMLQEDAKATGHAFTDAADVFRRRCADLELELGVVCGNRDDLADEVEALRCELAKARGE